MCALAKVDTVLFYGTGILGNLAHSINTIIRPLSTNVLFTNTQNAINQYITNTSLSSLLLVNYYTMKTQTTLVTVELIQARMP